ncbi:MAG: FtsX-like permease family protein, partial [Burkholderiales bacterium]
MAEEHPRLNRGLTLRAVALGEQAVKNLRLVLLVLLGAVAFVLLIACANVANLQLSRAVARQKEMAIRTALGAGRFRLIRQLLVENVLLALMGGTVGGLLALWGTDLLKRLPFNEPTFFMPYAVPSQQINIDGRVLGFTLLLALLTSLLCGLLPALQASNPNLNVTLKDGSRSSNSLTAQRSLFVVAEVALALLLLTGAGLMIKSFLRLQQVNPGFDPENVLTFDIRLPGSKYAENHQVADFYARLLERTAALPGVTAAGAVEFLPLSGIDSSTSIFIEGRPAPPPSERNQAHFRSATTDYFRALGLQLRQGRSFTAHDKREGPRVAIINETMARKYWPGENPIGKRVALDFETMRFRRDGPPTFDIPGGMREVVGVVADVKHARLEAETVPEMYLPAQQRPVREMSVVVRTLSEPLVLAAVVRRELSALDPRQPLSNLNT